MHSLAPCRRCSNLFPESELSEPGYYKTGLCRGCEGIEDEMEQDFWRESRREINDERRGQ